MELTWIFTVCRLTTSCSAICALVRPAVNRRSTSPSRAVSLAGGADEADIGMRSPDHALRLCSPSRLHAVGTARSQATYSRDGATILMIFCRDCAALPDHAAFTKSPSATATS